MSLSSFVQIPDNRPPSTDPELDEVVGRLLQLFGQASTWEEALDDRHRRILRAIGERLLGRTPCAATVQVGQPICVATKSFPTKFDFCPACKIDLMSNPETRVVAIDDEDVVVQCDCSMAASIPKWLFE